MGGLDGRFFLAGCAGVPFGTLADPGLREDTLKLLIDVDKASAGRDGCEGRKVVKTEVVDAPREIKIEGGKKTQGWWTERWTLDRCGHLIPYGVFYTYDGKGGVFFTVKRE